MTDSTGRSYPANASTVHLPPTAGSTVLQGLCQRFPAISREQWLDRMTRGRVLDAQGAAITAARLCPAEGLQVYYFREVLDEPVIAATETVLHVDQHLVVVDKPHFVPVVPSGVYVEQSLVRRLMRQLDHPDLVPLHRIDRATAGLVLFSANRASRALYHGLFQQGRIHKHYQALAAALPELDFPHTRKTRLVRGEPFFRMCEVDGSPNSETRIEVIESGSGLWRYGLQPITGKKHQLRVHLAALGAPIHNDPWYPRLREQTVDDDSQPLKLLAHSVQFVDPLSGQLRQFQSQLRL